MIKLSFKSKIILFSVLMVLAPLLFSGYYFYTTMSSVLTQTAYTNISQNLKKSNQDLEYAFNTIDNTFFNFFSSNTIRDWLSVNYHYANDNYLFFQNQEALKNDLRFSMLFNNAWEFKFISTAYLFSDKTNYSVVSRSPENPDQITQYNLDIFNTLTSQKIIGKYMTPASKKNQIIYISRSLNNLHLSDKILYLIIGVDENIITSRYASSLNYPNTEGYIINSEGIVYSSLNKDKLGTKLDDIYLTHMSFDGLKKLTFNNEDYFVEYSRISDTGLIFLALIPQKAALSELHLTIRNYLLFIIIILILSILLSLFLSFNFSKFIGNLSNRMQSVQKGNYDVKMPTYKDNDINNISEAFNSMTDEIKFLIQQVYEKQLLIKDTKIKFLQSQMNPHFLINILVTISTKAKISKDETIYEMITALNGLLQAGIYSTSNANITIREELNYVQFYLYLQKIRFEDRLSYFIEIEDDSFLDFQLPRLCIEPLVENAVVHGMEPTLLNCTIKIKIYKHLNNLHIQISDNGIGFDKNQLNHANSSTQKQFHNSIGLSNTNQRLKLTYGEEYGLEIDSSPSEGTTIVIKIPINQGDDSNV